jgi:hypothetical protein
MAGQRTNLNLEEIRSYINEGYDQKEIASLVGVHRNTLRSFLKEHDLNKKTLFYQISGSKSSYIKVHYKKGIQIDLYLF